MNKIEKNITFKNKAGYYLELLTPKTVKLLGCNKNKASKNKKGKSVSHREVAVLVHCNIFNNDYQQDSRVLCTFVPNKTFGQLLGISVTKFSFSKTLNSEFQAIEVWLTDQNSQSLE